MAGLTVMGLPCSRLGSWALDPGYLLSLLWSLEVNRVPAFLGLGVGVRAGWWW